MHLGSLPPSILSLARHTKLSGDQAQIFDGREEKGGGPVIHIQNTGLFRPCLVNKFHCPGGFTQKHSIFLITGSRSSDGDPHIPTFPRLVSFLRNRPKITRRQEPRQSYARDTPLRLDLDFSLKVSPETEWTRKTQGNP